jgi:two-component system phosphate regulon sensor histidine kinase PhoR
MNNDIKKSLASLPQQVTEHIQNLERMRQDFVANVSHELRTPLTVIHGYLETLIDEKNIDNLHKKIFIQMQQQTLRMENLVENLLLLSHLESDEHEVEIKKPVNIANLLHLILQEAKILSGDFNHTLTLDSAADLILLSRTEDLRSLFSNIIFNAIKYTPAGGQINIKCYKENNHIIFQVKDTGIGIAPEHIPRLTERFYRVDPARSRESGGTGLGLAIVKHILIRHNAELKIKSECGKGSIFTCFFPE